MTDPRVVDGLKEQLASWRAELKGGARRIGWKIGLNIPEVQAALGIEHPVIGHLTTARLIEPGGEYAGSEATALVAEPEIALEIGGDGAIAGYGPAIELADIDRAFDDVQAILAENIFHRAVVLGPPQPSLPEEVRVTLSVDGEERVSAETPRDFSDVVELTARLLREVNEALHAGDCIIAGSLTPPQPVRPGEQVTVDFGPLGRLAVRVT